MDIISLYDGEARKKMQLLVPLLNLNTDVSAIDIIDGQLTLINNIVDFTPLDIVSHYHGVTNCSYQEVCASGHTIAWFVFKLPFPLNFQEMPFHAKLANQDCVTKFLASGSCDFRSFLMSDGVQVADCVSGNIDKRLAALFRQTLIKQLKEPFNKEQYYKDIAGVQARNTIESMYKAGRQFRCRGNYNQIGGITLKCNPSL